MKKKANVKMKMTTKIKFGIAPTNNTPIKSPEKTYKQNWRNINANAKVRMAAETNAGVKLECGT